MLIKLILLTNYLKNLFYRTLEGLKLLDKKQKLLKIEKDGFLLPNYWHRFYY